ncbi:MAG: hypothetical protein KBS59_07575 [Clostridiales bacterium]|nr:hypothetical protein [Clostridiales bacterium]
MKEQAERDIRQIPVNMICPNPTYQKKKPTRSELRRTCEKIRKCFGEPLKVCAAPAADMYMLTECDERFHAALLLGLKSVPCEIFDSSVLRTEKFAVSDPRFLFNSIERLVQTSSRAGINASCVLEKTDGETVISVKVPSKTT